jgi:ABC-type lipoprotein release transport system permease subunit
MFEILLAGAIGFLIGFFAGILSLAWVRRIDDRDPLDDLD